MQKITLKTGKITKKRNFGYSVVVPVYVSERVCMSAKVFKRVVYLRYNNHYLYMHVYRNS